MTTRRSKDIGTDTERAVVRFLQRNGFPNAERRALHGNTDLGDVTGIPGVVIEIKGGDRAKVAGDIQVDTWLDETETERVNAKADYGILVLQRAGFGPERAGNWWAILRAPDIADLFGGSTYFVDDDPRFPVRIRLMDASWLLRDAGYGQQPDGGAA